jgi:23S rRNA (guanosine2251-2'-O)-methyltransferase
MFLFGKNQVLERLQARPQTIQKIIFNHKGKFNDIRSFAQKNNIKCVFLDEKEFFKIAKQANTQGVIAEVEDFKYSDLSWLLKLDDKEKYVLIALSNITDPQNLGSILRTAACFGRFALIIPKHRSASVNETVLKVSCGGENYVPVVQVTNLINAIKSAKDSGYWVAGTVVDQGQDVTDFKFCFPLCLVIGSEDRGIRPGLLEHLDYKLTLPMPGKQLSLNAAVATAVFCYEITKQRSRIRD